MGHEISNMAFVSVVVRLRVRDWELDMHILDFTDRLTSKV